MSAVASLILVKLYGKLNTVMYAKLKEVEGIW